MAMAKDGGCSAFNAVVSQRRIGRPGPPACTWRSGAPGTHDTDRDPVLLGDRVSCCHRYGAGWSAGSSSRGRATGAQASCWHMTPSCTREAGSDAFSPSLTSIEALIDSMAFPGGAEVQDRRPRSRPRPVDRRFPSDAVERPPDSHLAGIAAIRSAGQRVGRVRWRTVSV